MVRLALFALLIAGCYAPAFDGPYICVADSECPPEHACRAGCCGGTCPACSETLSGVGLADFAISFRIITTTREASAVLFQRAACASGDYWDIQLAPGGRLKVKLADARGEFSNLTTEAAVNDGQPHAVLARRTALTLGIWIDGAPAGSAPAPQMFGQLPPLGVGVDNPCVGPLMGTVAEVCLRVGGPP